LKPGGVAKRRPLPVRGDTDEEIEDLTRAQLEERDGEGCTPDPLFEGDWRQTIVDIRTPQPDGPGGRYMCGCEAQTTERTLARFIAHIRRTHQLFMLKIACPSMNGQCRHSIGTEWRKTNHEHMRTMHLDCEYREKDFPDFDMDS
jgi:hypothetical protein